MKKLFLFLITCFVLLTANFINADPNSINQKIIDQQHQKIEQLLQQITALTANIAQQGQALNQLNQQVTNLNQQIQQLTQQNQLLQNTNTIQVKELTVLQQIESKKLKQAHLQARALPTFTQLLLIKTQKDLLCSKESCHWAHLVTRFPSIYSNRLLVELNDFFSFNELTPLEFIILAVVLLVIFIAAGFMYGRYRQRKKAALIASSASVLLDKEIASISGEDLYASKLDLARAYIDMEDFISAKKILEDVKLGGNEAQKTEAQRLLLEISMSRP
ncbi:MAG: hypothetical protein A3E87_03290 [Gammaproteobacteria bacterium RIFCSPHIGHO2_12_FULL_35_23]|nr:MAG: hypothetical protein A3E87_03290 [Gammaproteobacteria bacterium RIFCSPHIGHO2_12_FULL_35_23]